MASKLFPFIKLVTKVTVAGGACYVAYDSGLLGESEKGSEILSKAKAAIPPAVEEWMKYFGFENILNSSKHAFNKVVWSMMFSYVANPDGFNESGLSVPTALSNKLPAPPKIDFSPTETWNFGVQKSISALSIAPTTACEYTNKGIQYLKGLTK